MIEIKKVLEIAATILCREDLLSTSLFGGTKNPSASQLTEFNRMLSCANLVLDEISTDYLSLTYEETFTPNASRKIPFSSFSKNFIRTVRAADKQTGKTLKTWLTPDGVDVGTTQAVTILYVFSVKQIALGDTLNDFGGRICARTVAYGIAAEFCMISGLFEDAVMWEKRYKDALLIQCSDKGEHRMKRRFWR